LFIGHLALNQYFTGPPGSPAVLFNAWLSCNKWPMIETILASWGYTVVYAVGRALNDT